MARIRQINSRSWRRMLGSLVLALTLDLLLLLLVPPHEPAYRGVRLSAWLNGSMAQGEPNGVGEVLNSVGPEALPWLVNTFEQNSHSNARWRLARWYTEFYGRHWRTPFPRLLPAIHNAPWEVIRFNAMPLLARLAPGTRHEDRVLTDILLEAPGPTDRTFANIRLRCLGRFTNCPAKVVPVLVAGITNPATIDTSIEAVRPFHASARAPLLKVAVAERGYVRPAQRALEEIDPEAFREFRAQKQASEH